MEIVFNDYSLQAQFVSNDEFLDSLANYTLPMLDVLKRCRLEVLKKYDSYNLNVTETKTIQDLLIESSSMVYPEIQKLKMLLVELTNNPYWEDDLKTDADSMYSTSFVGMFSGENPNCFSEAYERDKIVLSLEHNDFYKDLILINKDHKSEYLNNFHDIESSVKKLFYEKMISFTDLLSCLSKDIDVHFYKKDNSVYIDRELSKENLSNDDVMKIVDYYKKWIFGLTTGNMISHLTDSVTHKNQTYNELRVTLDNDQELRLFYKLFGSKYVFFNLLLKDTKTTPHYVKEKTRNLILEYIHG